MGAEGYGPRAEEEPDLSADRRTIIAAAAVVVVVAAVTVSRVDTSGPPTDPTGGEVALDGSDIEAAIEPWLSRVPDPRALIEEDTSTEDESGSTLRVWAHPDLPDGFEEEVAGLEGVAAVVTFRRGLVDLLESWDADGARVDELPGGYVVPMQAVGLDLEHVDAHPDLGSLGPGEVALSATAAELRAIGPGGVLDLEGQRFTVGAVLPDGVAGSAEVLLSLEDAERFGFTRRSVSVRYTGDGDALRDAIVELLPAEITPRVRTPRDQGAGPLVRSQIEMKRRFGEFAHGPVRADGSFTQDPAWVEANITTARVPILGTVTCHRDFIPIVAGALAELEEAGLAHLIDPADYEGCWAARRIASGRTISKHAWGAAIDINASTNAYGQTPTLDRRVVEAFERWGMRWGGDFLVPDGMHFEWYEDPTAALARRTR